MRTERPSGPSLDITDLIFIRPWSVWLDVLRLLQEYAATWRNALIIDDRKFAFERGKASMLT